MIHIVISVNLPAGSNSSNGAPALPSPSHMDVLNDTSYSNIDNIKDLSPEKFEIYIEQAKSNAKLAKERELHRSVLAQKDQKISSMQSEMNIMKRTITNSKVIMTFHCCVSAYFYRDAFVCLSVGGADS